MKQQPYAVKMRLITVYFCSIFAALLLSPANGSKPLVKAPTGATTTGHHIVVLKQDSSKSDLQKVMEKVKRMSDDVTVHRYTEHVGKTFTVDAPEHVLDKIRHLEEVRHVEEEDMAFEASISCAGADGVNTSCYLWFLDRLNQLKLPLDHIFTDTFNAEDERAVDVYVLDSGIEFEHYEFENRAKYAGYDPVDEYHFTTLRTPDYKPHNGRDCNGHGTLVASLIGGKTFGTAKKVNLLSVRVLGCDRAAPWSVILDGLDFISTEVAERRRPAIVSMALSGSVHSSLNTAIATLHNDKNVLIVGSAGNSQSDACMSSPANNAFVLRVGASTPSDKIYEKSNYGTCVDVFAPGEQITGADISCATCTTENRNGTSLASSLVCGIAAAHLSRSPLMQPFELKQKIIELSSKNILRLPSPSNSSNRLVQFDCGGTFTLSSVSGEVVIVSTNFPKPYQNNLKCTWTIHTPIESYAYIEFDFIKIEHKYDQLKVCNGKSCSEKNAQVAVLSGDYGEVACGYTSTANFLTLEFTTDGTTTSTGFRAKCMAEKRPIKLVDCKLSKKKTILQLDVESHGINVGNRFSISKDWHVVFGGRRQGINMAVINEVTGKVIRMENFGSRSTTLLSQAIENLDPGAFVVLGSSGNAAISLDARARRALSTLGSTYSNSINTLNSWAMIGIKGLARGRAVESLSESFAVNVSTQVKLQPRHEYGLRISVISGGKQGGGDIANITIDGKEVKITSDEKSNIGLNVVVINERSGEVLDTKVFNTNSEAFSDYSPSEAFVDFINALPIGRVVAIAIKGDAITHLTEEAKRACEKIGSRLIRYVRVDRSWAIIGRKNALPGEVAESVKYSNQAWATLYLPVNESKNTSPYCKISVSSSTGSSGSCSYSGNIGTFITIGNSTFPSNLCLGFGITFGLVHENNCTFERTVTYNTQSYYWRYQNSVRNFINAIENGRIVVAISHAQSNGLDSNARAALESIGSAHIRNVGTYHAWAIIGRKGAAPGSVPEFHNDGSPYTAAISAKVPLTVPELPIVSSCEDSIYPLNCRAGITV